jgi:sec-independent protein translocase protein TatC
VAGPASSRPAALDTGSAACRQAATGHAARRHGSRSGLRAGAWFGFAVLLPPAIKFLLGFGSDLATPLIAVGDYVTLLVSLMLWMGIVFELPIVMFLLAKMGVMPASWIGKQRRWAILAAFVLGAIITPSFDPLTQSIAAGPIIVLYEAGYWLSKLAERGRKEVTQGV